MISIPLRHFPTPGQREHSPQRHTVVGTAAPTTTDMENTVPQCANPTQTTYAAKKKPGHKTPQVYFSRCTVHRSALTLEYPIIKTTGSAELRKANLPLVVH